MTSSEWKQRGQEWQAARKAQQRQREEQFKQQREARYQQNLILKAHGYRWSKTQDIYGPSDDGDNAGWIWILHAPDGREISLSEAMHAISEEAHSHHE